MMALCCLARLFSTCTIYSTYVWVCKKETKVYSRPVAIFTLGEKVICLCGQGCAGWNVTCKSLRRRNTIFYQPDCSGGQRAITATRPCLGTKHNSILQHPQAPPLRPPMGITDIPSRTRSQWRLTMDVACPTSLMSVPYLLTQTLPFLPSA